MREIKFRAWDGERMLSPEDIYIYDGKPCWKNEHDHIGVKKGVLMQFTGLLDKNGKEIYEGDVVKVMFPVEFVGVVEYDAPEWRIRRKSGTLWRFAECPEVIGNVFENPELIEVTK